MITRHHYSPETARILAEVEAKESLAKESSEKSAALDAALIEALSDGVIVINLQGVIVRVNAAAEMMFGYPREELLGKPIEMLVPEALREGHPDLRKSYMNNPRVRPMGVGREVHGRRKTGEEFIVNITLAQFSTPSDIYILSEIAHS